MKTNVKQYRYFIYSIALLFASNLSAHHYPSYDSALRYLFRNYDCAVAGQNIMLANTPQGWIVYQPDFANNKYSLKGKQLLYSRKQHKWKPLNFPKRNDKLFDESTLEKTDYGWLKYYQSDFNKYMYYGYDNWSTDVIQHFKNRKPETPFELESLYRAYYNYARGFIFGTETQFVANADEPIRHFNPDTLIMDRWHIDSFVHFITLTLDCMHQLASNYPEYMLVTGTAKNRLASDYVDAYMLLEMHGFGFLGKPFLLLAEYDDNAIQMAKNRLGAVPQNAIYISDSDNDAYPFWFLQQRLGYRTDVQVINQSLLFSKRYREMCLRSDQPFGTVSAHTYQSLNGHQKSFVSKYCRIVVDDSATASFDTILYHAYTKNSIKAPSDTFRIENQNQVSYWYINHLHDLYIIHTFLLDILQSDQRPVVIGSLGVHNPTEWPDHKSGPFYYNISHTGISCSDPCVDSLQMLHFISEQYLQLPYRPYNPNDFVTADFIAELTEMAATAILYAKDHHLKELPDLVSRAYTFFPDMKRHFNNKLSKICMVYFKIGEVQKATDILNLLLEYAEDAEVQNRKFRKAHPREPLPIVMPIPPTDQLNELREFLYYSDTKYPGLEKIDAFFQKWQ